MNTSAARMMMRSTSLLAMFAAAACASVAQDQRQILTPIAALHQTVPSATQEVAAGAIVMDGADIRIVGATALGGLEVYNLAGERLSVAQAGEVAGVDVAYGYKVDGKPMTIVAAIDTTQNALRLFQMTGAALTEVGARAIPLGFAAENVCMFHNSLDGALYAFIVGDGGEIDQQLIYTNAEGRLDARQSRRLSVMSTNKQCVVDNASGVVYVSEESVGVWRFNANPEAFAAPQLIASPRMGEIEEEVGGLALHDGGEGARWLVVSDVAAGRLNVYDRDKDDAYLGSVTVTAPMAVRRSASPDRCSASATPQAACPTACCLSPTKTARISRPCRSRRSLTASACRRRTPTDPRTFTQSSVPTVTPTFETAAVPSFGDAADDPAIWANAATPRRA